MLKPAYLFDLDGTLLDSSPDIAKAANVARAAFDEAPLSTAEIAAHIGWGLGHLLQNVLPNLDGVGLGRARAVFIEHYGAHLLDDSRPYPGVEACLAGLSVSPHPLGASLHIQDASRRGRLRTDFCVENPPNTAGICAGPRLELGPQPPTSARSEYVGKLLGLVTNKPGFFLKPTLEGLGWASHFACVVAGDTLTERKPHPAPIQHALAALGVCPTEAVYIGDSEVDRAAAAAAGVGFLAVSWGRVAGLGDDRARLPAEWLAPVRGLIE